ncbi:MAG: PepSY domain-containing protein [Aurantimonas endophytica]|uniref:Putative iron-regulated membrane protein n=1 Tax=Aurantimonas endophytica TaxID=1522175 RepID=A0A7W6HGS1_9HYPH|nr:PepSY domain-containing protein [Aurantimonas endophytica]MBB4004898.1 putative iron-regulated membrane protein [Aurantimonas endophytica]MCO6405706.1 PepSY domain-containing protein [Aurantimonas endophytica]
MSRLVAGQAEDAARSSASPDLYRAVWRWHFYAGLFVLPFLVTLSITGALYLFRDEIDAFVHADLKTVEIRQDAALASPSAVVAAATAAYPGTAVKYTDPATPDSSAEITVNADSGERLAVYVDPYDGAVLGALADRGTVMWTVRYLHSLRYFGPVARGIIEIAGGWAILLVGTGIFLWWPRGQKGGVVSVRGRPRNRLFWRDVHAVTGSIVGCFIVFLAVTGMPWSQVWGGKVNEWANGANFGYPPGVRTDVPMSGSKLSDEGLTAWSMEQAQVPTSPGASAATQPIGLDRAAAIFDDLGLNRGYAVNIPGRPDGVYTGSVYPDDLSRQRVVHLDQYTGEPLVDMSYADYGPGGRWLEWGINVHMGQQYGLLNQLLLLAVCVGNVLLAVSAGVMWWKRRPSGSMGVPPMPQDRGVFRGLLAILVVGGIVFPLVGASLLVMLALDWAMTRRRPALA